MSESKRVEIVKVETVGSQRIVYTSLNGLSVQAWHPTVIPDESASDHDPKEYPL